METLDSFEVKIEENINSFKNRIPLFRKKHKNPEELGVKKYLLFVLGANSIFLAEDILALIRVHKDRKHRTKRGLNTLLRNLLELFIYFKYITSNDDFLQMRMDLFVLKSEIEERKLFNSFLELGKRGKFIFSEDPKRVTSIEWINNKITSVNELYSRMSLIYGEVFKSELGLMGNIKGLCRRYDEENGIQSVQKGKEAKSLEWCYDFLYRFQSKYAHQGLRTLEDVINIYFEGKDKDEELEILAMLDWISTEYSNKFKAII